MDIGSDFSAPAYEGMVLFVNVWLELLTPTITPNQIVMDN